MQWNVAAFSFLIFISWGKIHKIHTNRAPNGLFYVQILELYTLPLHSVSSILGRFSALCITWYDCLQNHSLPQFIFLPALLDEACVVVKEGGLMLAEGFDGFSGGQVQQQARLPATGWTHQHTLDSLYTCHGMARMHCSDQEKLRLMSLVHILQSLRATEFNVISCWAGGSHWHDKRIWILVSYSWILFKNGVCTAYDLGSLIVVSDGCRLKHWTNRSGHFLSDKYILFGQVLLCRLRT